MTYRQKQAAQQKLAQVRLAINYVLRKRAMAKQAAWWNPFTWGRSSAPATPPAPTTPAPAPTTPATPPLAPASPAVPASAVPPKRRRTPPPEEHKTRAWDSRNERYLREQGYL